LRKIAALGVLGPCLTAVGSIEKLSSHFAGTNKVGQQSKIPVFVTHPSGDNRRIDFEPLRKFSHRKRRWIVFHSAGLPNGVGNKSIFRPSSASSSF